MKRFVLAMPVTAEFAKEQPHEARAIALDALSSQPLVGPRGGRYEPVGPVYDFVLRETRDDFQRGVMTFFACRNARYVRPKK